jgi:hypothetical protein
MLRGIVLSNPTPRDRMVDAHGRPYFLWDVDMTLAAFEHKLEDPDVGVRAYLVGKMMRQAKPDDVFQFVTMRQIDELWPRLERYLGKSLPFWTFIHTSWKARRGERK